MSRRKGLWMHGPKPTTTKLNHLQEGSELPFIVILIREIQPLTLDGIEFQDREKMFIIHRWPSPLPSNPVQITKAKTKWWRKDGTQINRNFWHIDARNRLFQGLKESIKNEMALFAYQVSDATTWTQNGRVERFQPLEICHLRPWPKKATNLVLEEIEIQ